MSHIIKTGPKLWMHGLSVATGQSNSR